MSAVKFNSESLDTFIGIGGGIIPEVKDFLFDLMLETAISESLYPKTKEDRIYLISTLHHLFSGLEVESRSPNVG